MSAWLSLKLDQLGTVERGRSRHRPRNDPALYGGSYPFIQTGDVKAAGLRLYEFDQTYNETGLAQSRLWPEGTLCFTIAANIGDTAILGLPACFPDSIVGFTPYPKKSDVLFVKYLLDYAKMRFSAISRGATQDNLSLQKLLSQDLLVPPLEIQRRIASILGAYDDLIEVNRRRVAVLEEMARGLFEDWFVRFRFPGHENVPIIDASDGRLPEAWEAKTINEASSYVNRGIAPKYDESSDTLVVNQKCIRDGRLSLSLARRQLKVPPLDKVVQEGDILINSTGVGTLGRVAQAEEVPQGLTVDSHVTIVRPICPGDRDFLGLLMSSMQPTFEQLGAGSTGQTELSRHAVGAQVVTWPPEDLRIEFGKLVRPMRTLVSELMRQNACLATSRDLLLPRLISGQLSVEAAERQLEDAA
jgi:type I restriction enzyme S subunit